MEIKGPARSPRLRQILSTHGASDNLSSHIKSILSSCNRTLKISEKLKIRQHRSALPLREMFNSDVCAMLCEKTVEKL
jgi:hypothetical protein